MGMSQLKENMNDLYNSIRVVKDSQMANALGFLKVVELEEGR